MTHKWLVHGILLAALAGCEPSAINLPTMPVPREATPLGERFDASQCGTLEGRVRWNGGVPVVATVRRPLSTVSHEVIPNPNALHLDAKESVIGALVMIRGVDPARSKPWPHAPVEVELHDRGITVHQGVAHGRFGIVRRGDVVVIRSSGEKSLGVRGRGADFFSHILPPHQSRITRVVSKEGRVELASASGQFWASADLIVSDHPYLMLTDAQGCFRFNTLPAGDYQLHVLVPNWIVDTTEIDPESGLVVRQHYKPPIEQVVKVIIESREIAWSDVAMPIPLE